MSKADKQWARYLFARHNLIALRPLNRDLQLLDVLVKKGSHGFIRNRGPIIVKIGSILSLRKEDDNPDWEQWAGLAKDGLSRLGENKDLENNELFSAGVIGDYESNTEFASKVILSLSSCAGMGGDIAKSSSVSALHVTYEKFTEDSAVNLFYSDIHPALWKPNLQRIKLEEPITRSDGTLDLWVVKEIYYAKDIQFKSRHRYGAHVRVDLLSMVIGILKSLFGYTQKAKAKIGEAKDEGVQGQKVPFGFKATRLVYQENGNLIAKHSNMGMKRRGICGFEATNWVYCSASMPSFGGMEMSSPGKMIKVDPSTFFNVDKDPMYHMGGFFSQGLGDVDNIEEMQLLGMQFLDDEEEGMQLLDVVTNGDGHTMAQ